MLWLHISIIRRHLVNMIIVFVSKSLVGQSAGLESGRSGFRIPLAPGFFRGRVNGDLKTDTPVATLPEAWRFRVSAVTGWLGVSILMESLICNLQIKRAISPSHSIQTLGQPVRRADPITPGTLKGGHWSASFDVSGTTRLEKHPRRKRESNSGPLLGKWRPHLQAKETV